MTIGVRGLPSIMAESTLLGTDLEYMLARPARFPSAEVTHRASAIF